MEPKRQIILKQVSDDEQVKITLSANLTWPEVTDRFISFLQACGYIFKGIEVGEYIMAEYNYQLFENKEEECQNIDITNGVRSEIRKKKKRKKK